MFTYKASFVEIPEGFHAEVVDFPGVITFGKDLDDARRSLASALEDMAETNVLLGEALPLPDPSRTNPDADIEEPIYLLLTAANRVTIVPEAAAS
jgi:predicted RNase H-like HicB family nuclease